jgi:Transposase, Mutator family
VIWIDDDRVRDDLKNVVRSNVEETLNAMLDAEAEQLCNASRYERTEAWRDTRAGSYGRKLQTQAGRGDAEGAGQRQHIERYQRRESSVEEALIAIAPPSSISWSGYGPTHPTRWPRRLQDDAKDPTPRPQKYGPSEFCTNELSQPRAYQGIREKCNAVAHLQQSRLSPQRLPLVGEQARLCQFYSVYRDPMR